MGEEVTTTRKKPPAEAELRDLISQARRAISAVPGANKQIGMELRLQEQERRLGLRKP
jgi:hypothetical protein